LPRRTWCGCLSRAVRHEHLEPGRHPRGSRPGQLLERGGALRIHNSDAANNEGAERLLKSEWTPYLGAINRWIVALSERKTDDARIEAAQRAAPQALSSSATLTKTCAPPFFYVDREATITRDIWTGEEGRGTISSGECLRPPKE
jgi:hypothetical protein